MTVDQIAAVASSANFADEIIRSRHQPVVDYPWETARLQELRAKAAADYRTGFERSCARGQLAAADGNFALAEAELLKTLADGRDEYPHNGRFLQNIVQLGLVIQALDLVARFANDWFEAGDVFIVEAGAAGNAMGIDWVRVDEAGKCHLSVDLRMLRTTRADYYVSHWISSAPLWSSYCHAPGCEPGEAPMNSGDASAVPGLAYCANETDHFLIPDAYFIGLSGYAAMRAKYDAHRPSWGERAPVAFWRGSTTGRRTGRGDWQSLPRIRLCRIAQQNQHLFDVGLSSVAQAAGPTEKPEIEAAGLLKEPVPAEGFLKFRYQIDIDGNTNAWSGLYQKLLTGSPVLKVASPHGFRQWYYDRLRPWLNYVPVAADMSDLVDKVEWLRSHDDKARAIGEAGLALARSLDYRQEIDAAHDTIRASFRYRSFKDGDRNLFRDLQCQVEQGDLAGAAATLKRLSAPICPQRRQLLHDIVDGTSPVAAGRDNSHIQTSHKTLLLYSAFDGHLHHEPFDRPGPLPAGKFALCLETVGRNERLALRYGQESFVCQVRATGEVKLAKASMIDDQQSITAERHEGFIALRLQAGYVCAELHGDLAYNRQVVQGWEKFVCLKTAA